MARKYINDVGIPDIMIDLKPDDKRFDQWKSEVEEYGFANYETWCMDYFFYGWLYERLKHFLKVACIDLTFHKFEFEGKEYTQKEMIDKMLHGCELAFEAEFRCKILTEEEKKAVEDVRWIWATVMPAMWW